MKDADSLAVLMAILGMTVIPALLLMMPFVSIWSLNTLFSLAIPLTFKTWCAAFALSAIVSGRAGRLAKK